MTDLEIIAFADFVMRDDGVLFAEFPNKAGIIEIKGDTVRFIPYGGEASDIDSFKLVRVEPSLNNVDPNESCLNIDYDGSQVKLLHVTTPEEGYWLNNVQIAKVEEQYKAKYMGYWCTKNFSGGWNEQPVDVFYVADPDTSKGHSNYFGMYYTETDQLMITNAESAFSEPMVGVECNDGEVLISRFRHDYVMKGDAFIDGGRDYYRYNPAFTLIEVTVKDGQFQFDRTLKYEDL